jgi:hypothetical protein
MERRSQALPPEEELLDRRLEDGIELSAESHHPPEVGGPLRWADGYPQRVPA